MPKIFKKFVISFFIFILTFSLLTPLLSPNVKAEGEWYNQSFVDWHNKVFDNSNPDEIFGERYTRAQVQWIVYSLGSFFLNGVSKDAGNILICTTTKDFSNCATTVQEMFKEASTDTPNTTSNNQSILSAVFQPRPISAVTYVTDISKNLKIVPEAQAQTGFGFTALNPILDLWKASRNMAYSLLILVVIALAFMIMFRVKLTPQTAVTVQSALPKVAIAIVLITFSYAIAGLLIDLMYVVIGIISLALSQSGVYGKFLQPQNSVDIFNLITQGPSVFGARMGILGFIARYWIGSMAVMFLIFIGGNSAFMKIGSLLGFIVMLCFIMVLLWNWAKIAWLLLKTTAMVLLQTIIAPLQILIGVVVPNVGFGAWFRSYASNLAVFPVVGILFVLANLFLVLSISAAFNGIFELGTIFGSLIPNFIDQAVGRGGWPPLLAIGNEQTTIALVYFGVSIVMITIIPKTADLVKTLIKGGQFNYGSAIGEAMGPLKTVGIGGVQYTSGYVDKLYPGWSTAGITGKQQTIKSTFDFLKTLKIIR